MTDLNQLLKEAIEDLEAWADYFGDERSKEAAKDVAGLARCGTTSGCTTSRIRRVRRR